MSHFRSDRAIFGASVVALGSLILLQTLSSVALAQSWSQTVSGGIRFEDNLNRAERNRLRQEDGVLELEGALSYRAPLTERSGLIAKLHLGGENYVDHGDLDNLALGGALTYLIHPGDGYLTPWFALTASYEVTEFAASDIRDGSETALSFDVGKRFSDRLTSRFGYRLSDQDASKSRVFERRLGTVSGRLKYTLGDEWSLSMDYSYQHGNVVTTAPANPKFRGRFRAVAMDRVFGANFVAWRLGEGKTHRLAVGTQYAFNKTLALNFRASRSLTSADGDNRWHAWTAGASLAYRFH